MSERDPELERLFRAARRAEDPTDEDRRAVRRALAARLATAAAAGAAVSLSTRAAAAAGSAAFGKSTLLGWFAAGLGAGAAVGTVVTVAVVSRGPEAPPPRAPSAAVAPVVSAPRTAPPLGTWTSPLEAPSAPSAVAPLPTGLVRPTSSAPAPSLEVETRAFGDVQRALREGRPEEALRLLAEQEGRFARGSLQEERAAARVLALCAAGRLVEGQAARSRFLARYPQSPAADRVRASCTP